MLWNVRASPGGKKVQLLVFWDRSRNGRHLINRIQLHTEKARSNYLLGTISCLIWNIHLYFIILKLFTNFQNIQFFWSKSFYFFIPQYNNSFLHFRLASPLHRQSWWVKPALVQVGSCTYERSQIRRGNCPSSWRTVVA